MDLGISGRKALVCAASKGLGKASALALAAEGVDLFLCARDEGSLAAVKDEIVNSFGVAVKYCEADLTIKSDRETLIHDVQKEFGKIDILVHNIGGPPPSTVTSTKNEEWMKGFDRLFMSIVELNEAFVPAMRQQKWGRIVTITSITVLEPIDNLAISNSFRSATTAMLKTLSSELAAENVTVNCVAPGNIASDRHEQLIVDRVKNSGRPRQELEAEMLSSIPAGRFADPSEFGSVVAFLCSEKASYVTGSTLCVDGGKRKSTY